jgi:UDP-glucose 6-dehydrogenase
VNEINRAQHDLLAEIVTRQVRLSGVQSVGILGLSYKASTPYVIESASIALIETLHAGGIRIIAYDTLALKAAALQFGELFEAATTANACVHAAAVIVLINEDSTYTDAILSYKGGDAKVVVDCWRALDAHAAIPNVKVVKLGYWGEPA